MNDCRFSPRIEPKPDETVNEPPSRTFVYRLRPTKAGEAVLPPVAIASYDPALSRYITHVTASVPVRVVAVASFDPATIDDPESSDGSGRFTLVAWAVWGSSAVLLLAASVSLALVRRRLRRIRPFRDRPRPGDTPRDWRRSLESDKMTSSGMRQEVRFSRPGAFPRRRASGQRRADPVLAARNRPSSRRT